MPETVYQVLDRIEAAAMCDEVEVAPTATPLEFLQAIYRDANQPMQRRIKAAIEAAPYMHPKLSVVASVNDDGRFAERLEAAIKRSGKVIEHESAATMS